MWQIPAGCRPDKLPFLRVKAGISNTEREREIDYIFSSHLRADQMCRGSFLGIHQRIAPRLSCHPAT